MTSTSKQLPQTLLVPLSDSNTMQSIIETLTDRERKRMQFAHRHHLRLQSHARATSTSTSDTQAKDDEHDSSGCPMSLRMEVGTRAQNLTKNRYRDIVPYDEARFLLPAANGLGANDLIGSTSTSRHVIDDPSRYNYVNASLIQEPDLGLRRDDTSRRWWIAAQGPTSTTIHEFLSMLLAHPSSPRSIRDRIAPLPKIKVIVQLSPLVEQNREKIHPYFPDVVGDVWEDVRNEENDERSSVWVRLAKKTTLNDGSRRSELVIGRLGEEGRKVVHLEYRGWRDHGVPEDTAHLIDFVRTVLNMNDEDKPERPPVLAHCSAGVGRTGTFITVASLLPSLPFAFQTSDAPRMREAERAQHPLGAEFPERPVGGGKIDFIGRTIDHLRDHRCTMVQTSEQIVFCYRALAFEWFRMQR